MSKNKDKDAFSFVKGGKTKKFTKKQESNIIKEMLESMEKRHELLNKLHDQALNVYDKRMR